MKILKIAILPLVLGSLALGSISCEKKTPSEEAADNIEDATDEMGDAAEDAGDAIEDAVDQ